ncbi:MAG: universal stress protein [Ignavibacteriales bacterium]|nr:universal stress protein [Ignavibacteriales bacterium]
MESYEIAYKHILYTTEFSDSWQDVFSHALGISKHYNAKLTFLYVLNTELIDLLTFDVGLERLPSIDKKFTEAKDFTNNVRTKILEKMTSSYSDDILNDIDILVERGNPARIILNIAEEKNCDLIVMGFSGRGTSEDTAIGSTVSRVLHKSKLPVLVIHNVNKKN